MVAAPGQQELAVRASAGTKQQPGPRDSAKPAAPVARRGSEANPGKLGEPAGQPVLEASPPATAPPAEPSTPSAESKEPVGPSGHGSGGDEPDAALEAASAPQAAAAALPEAAAPAPDPAEQQATAQRPKRGRRPKAARVAALEPAAPRARRASAVAAAGFLAKVIDAETKGADVAKDDDLGYQADFRRSAKRKPSEELKGPTARVPARRAFGAANGASPWQAAPAVRSGRIITHLPPPQPGGPVAAGGLQTPQPQPVVLTSAAGVPVQLLPVAAAQPPPAGAGAAAAAPEASQQQPVAPQAAELPAASARPEPSLAAPPQAPQPAQLAVQQPAQLQASQAQLPDADPAAPQPAAAAAEQPPAGQLVPAPPAAASPPVAQPVGASEATGSAQPDDQQLGQPQHEPKLYPLPPVLQRLPQPMDVASEGVSQAGAVPDAGQAAPAMAPAAAPAAVAPAASGVPADEQPEKRKRRKYRRRLFSGGRDKSSYDDDMSDSELFGDDDFLPVATPPPPPVEMDDLFGCSKCRYAKNGCLVCRERPTFSRPKQRWRPQQGRPQDGISPAPVFRPTEEEFKDPLAYINSCRPEGERCGIVCIVPPPSFKPPFALERGTNGQSADSFKFAIRKQLTSHLCMRAANKPAERRATRRGYGATTHKEGEADDEFGFVTMEKRHTLRSFAAYADWVKAMHFSDPAPKPKADDPACKQTPKRRKAHTYNGPEPSIAEIEAEFWRIVETPDDVYESLYGQDLDSGHHGSGFPLPPFRAALLREHLAGQEARVKEAARRAHVPAAEARAALLKEKQQELGSGIVAAIGGGDITGAADSGKQEDVKAESDFATHAWNINNLPRNRGSTLRYLAGNELITGVQVPWLYVGSVLSAFCWHIEDHALYSVNYHHLGAPKVWYGVPAHASEALEEAMADALPHLFDAAPNLIYQLVTMVSPKQLAARGVPVYRLVHEEGSFVVTFPNAFHSGFNTGFNCAEAVNFGPPDWLPYGTDRAQKYRGDMKPLTLSHDALLVTLVTAAPAAAEAARARGVDLAAVPLPADSVAAAGAPFTEAELQDVAVQDPAAIAKGPGAIEAVAPPPTAESSAAPAGAANAPVSSSAPNHSAGAPLASDALPAVTGSGAEAQPMAVDCAAAGTVAEPSQPSASCEAAAQTAGQSPTAQPAAPQLTAQQPAGSPAGSAATGAELATAAKLPALPSATAAGAGAADGRPRRHRGDEQAQRPADGCAAGGGDCLVGGLLGKLDPVSVADAPPEGIRLAAGELTLRVAEERRRIALGSQQGPMPQTRMTGEPGAIGSDGCHTDTTDVDCEVCKTDLWLSAVVTPLLPGRAVCPEHAAALPAPPAQRLLLLRHTPVELEAMIATAAKLVGGTREAIAFARKRHAMWLAMRPPVQKIGPMAAPQRGGLVAPMPAFAAGGPMPDPGAPLLTSLEYVSYDDSPQVPAKRKYVRRKPPAARSRSGALPTATTAGQLQQPAANGSAEHGAAAADAAADSGLAGNGTAGSSGEEVLGVGRRHKPRKLLYEAEGDYIEEDPFSHKRPRKSNYYEWKGRKPPRVRRAPFPQPPPQLASDAATEFALPQHITDPPPAAAPAAVAPAAATNGLVLSADGAEQQASPSVWAKIISGLGPSGAPSAAAAAMPAANTAEHMPAGAAAVAAQPAQVQGGGADGTAAAEAAVSGPVARLAGGMSGVELPHPSGAGLVPQVLPAADADPPAAGNASGMLQPPLQQAAALSADGQDSAVPMDVDAVLSEPQPAASEPEAAMAAAPASADQGADGSAAPAAEPPAEPAAQASRQPAAQAAGVQQAVTEADAVGGDPAGQAADVDAAATAVVATDAGAKPTAAEAWVDDDSFMQGADGN